MIVKRKITTILLALIVGAVFFGLFSHDALSQHGTCTAATVRTPSVDAIAPERGAPLWLKECVQNYYDQGDPALNGGVRPSAPRTVGGLWAEPGALSST